MLVSVMSSTYFKKGADQLLVNSGLETKGLQHRRLQLYQSEKTSSRTKPINPFKLFHCSRTLRSFWTRCPKARLDPMHTRSIHTASLPVFLPGPEVSMAPRRGRKLRIRNSRRVSQRMKRRLPGVVMGSVKGQGWTRKECSRLEFKYRSRINKANQQRIVPNSCDLPKFRFHKIE